MSVASPDLAIEVLFTRRELDAVHAVADKATQSAWARRVLLAALDHDHARHEINLERLHETLLEWQKATFERLAALDHGKLVNTHDPKPQPAIGSPIAVLSLLLVSLACVAGSVAMTVWGGAFPLTMGLLGVSAVLGGVAFVLSRRPPQPRVKARTPKPRTEQEIDSVVAAARKDVEARAAMLCERGTDRDRAMTLAWAEVTFRTLATHMQFVSAYAEQQALGMALADKERTEEDIDRVVAARLGASDEVWHKVQWRADGKKGDDPERDDRGR